VRVVNAVSCEPDDTFGQGAFQARVFDLTERLGASVIGATVYEMEAVSGFRQDRCGTWSDVSPR
jgi:hypothetical protein